MAADSPSLRTAWPVLTALAIAVLGVTGALLLGGTEEDPTVLRAGYALDPEDPWPLRGDASLVAGDALADLPDGWGEAEPLFAHRSDGDLEVVLLDGARRRWAVAVQTAVGWQLEPHGLLGETGVLASERPGQRVLAVADPRVDSFTAVTLAGTARTEELDLLADGVAEAAVVTDRSLGVVGAVDGEPVVRGEVRETGDA